MSIGLFTKPTRERIAACESVGLSYWSDHPFPSHAWAVNAAGEAHVVRIRRAQSTAEHTCCASAIGRYEIPDSERKPCKAAA